MSFVENIAEGVGSALEPVSGALDFLGLGASSPLGDAPDSRDIWGALGQGVKEAAMATPLGLVTGAAGFAQGVGQMSARDRLIYGGLLLAGGVGAARAVHARYRANTPKMMPAPSGLAESRGIGLAGLYDDLSGDAAALQRARPGIRGRQAQILAPADEATAAKGMARFSWSDDTDPRLAGITGVLTEYGRTHPAGPGGGRVDWARFDHAIDHGLLKYDHNKPVRDAYRKLTAGEALTGAELEGLTRAVRALGDATEGLDADDLTIGLTGRVVGIDYVNGEAVLHVQSRLPDPGDVHLDERTRAKALTLLNPRAYATQGKANFRRLWDIGVEDMRIRDQGVGTPLLPEALERGPEWYYAEHNNIADAWGLDRVPSPELGRAVAITSLLSEGETWATNIQKGAQAWRMIEGNKRVADQDFQNWLRDGVPADARDGATRRIYSGKKAKQHEKTFSELHAALTAAGVKIDRSNLNKVARLMSESADELFLSTNATKQKNFYLNLLYPDAEYPVTVDRHQFDAFYGLDSGTQDRPVGDPLGAGATTYDVIADTVRQLANEISEETGTKVLPHQVQAVVWETWRAMKFAHKGGWTNADGTPGDPFRLKPAGGENPVYLALLGQGQGEVFPSIFGGSNNSLPVAALREGADGFQAVLGGGGAAVYATSVDRYTDQVAKHLYPSIKGADGVARWATARPQFVHDATKIPSTVAADDFAHVETYSTRAITRGTGEYPGLSSGEWVVFDAPEGFRPKGFLGRAMDLGGVEVNTTRHDHTKIGRQALIDEPAVRAKLQDNAWSIIIGDPKAASKARAAGYDPISLGNDSFMVFGAAGAEAQRWAPGRRVISNGGERAARELRPVDQPTIDDLATRLQENDGFTYDPATGTFPEEGVAISDLNGAELEIPVDQFSREQLEDFIEQNAVLLGRPGAHIGGWHDRERGLYVLDISGVHPEGSDIKAVLDRQKQKAGFNLRTFEEVENPSWPYADRSPQPEVFTIRAADGKPVTFDPAEYVAEHGSLGPERAVRRTSRFALPVDRSRTHAIEMIARDLEHRGASNLVVHTTRTNLPGFERAREHVYSDGIQTAVVRTNSNVLGRTNSVPVWVRSAAGLPADVGPSLGTVQVGPDTVVGNAVMLKGAKALTDSTAWDVDPIAWTMSPGVGQVERRGSKFIIEADTETDVLSAVRRSEVLRAAGVAPSDIEIRTSEGRFGLEGEVTPTIERSPVVRTKFGTKAIMSNRNASDDDIFVGQFRFSPRFKLFDPRTQKLVDRQLDPSLVGPVQRAMEKFLAKHENAAEVWRLPGVMIDGDDPGALAFVNWEAGSPVQLVKTSWADAGALRHVLARDQQLGWQLPRVTDPVEGVVLHELGHVLHGATILQQGWKKNPEIDKALKALIKKHGGPKGVGKALSQRAAVEPSELVAESVAEVLGAKKPGKLARDVYDLVTGEFESSFKYRGLLWEAAS